MKLSEIVLILGLMALVVLQHVRITLLEHVLLTVGKSVATLQELELDRLHGKRPPTWTYQPPERYAF